MDFEKNMTAGTYSSSPEPLRLKKEPPVPYTMQVFVIPTASGDFTVLEHIMLQPNTLHKISKNLKQQQEITITHFNAD